MLASTIGKIFAKARNFIAKIILQAGIPPNLLTLTGLIITIVAAFFLANGMFWIAGIFIIFAGAFDILDGAVAKIGNKRSTFGAFFDSTIDRYSDFSIFLGIILYYIHISFFCVTLSIIALIGSQFISYTRARAENLISSCKVGYWERGERIVAILLGVFFLRLPTALLILAIFTHITALQRIIYTYGTIKKNEQDEKPSLQMSGFGRWVANLFAKEGKTFPVITRKILLWEFSKGSIAYDIAAVVFILLIIFINVSA